MKKFELELHLLYTPLAATLQLVLAEAKKVPLGHSDPQVIEVFNSAGQHSATLRKIDTREDSLSVENAEPQHKRSQRSQFKPEKPEFVIVEKYTTGGATIWHYRQGHDSGLVAQVRPDKTITSWVVAMASRERWDQGLSQSQRRFETVEDGLDWIKQDQRHLPELVVLDIRSGKMLVAAAGSEYVRSVHLADDPSDYHETYYRRGGVLELVQKQPDRFKRFENEAAARTWWNVDRLTEWVLADRLTGTIWYYPGGEELGKKADIIDLSTWTPVSMKRWEALELLRNGCTKSFKTVAEAVCWLSR